MNTIYSVLAPLSDEQREDARDYARAMVARASGEAPKPEQFAASASAEYPLWVTRMIAGFMVLAFIGAAMPSLFRLFSAGRDYFLAGIDDQWQAAIVGISTFILAEFLVILSTVSASVLYKGKARFIFVLPVMMGLSMALVGNWTIVKPHDLFSLLEAIIPVFAVLFIAIVGERLMLHAIAERHAARRAYADALAQWRAAHVDPEQHPRYMSYYANALRAALVKHNSSGRGAEQRKTAMQALTNAQWRYLIQRELSAESWFILTGDADQDAPAVSITTPEETTTSPRPFGLMPPTKDDRADISATPTASEHIETASASA